MRFITLIPLLLVLFCTTAGRGESQRPPVNSASERPAGFRPALMSRTHSSCSAITVRYGITREGPGCAAANDDCCPMPTAAIGVPMTKTA